MARSFTPRLFSIHVSWPTVRSHKFVGMVLLKATAVCSHDPIIQQYASVLWRLAGQKMKGMKRPRNRRVSILFPAQILC